MTPYRLQWALALLCASLASLSAPEARAYISGAVSAPAGSFDASLGFQLQRGKVAPLDAPDDVQIQKALINEVHVSGGYAFGEAGFLKDLSLRVSETYFTSQAEVLGGAVIYPEDKGHIVSVTASANFVHEVSRAFGAFVRVSHPIGMDLSKFSNPRVDRLGIGFQAGFEITDTLGYESLIYLGSGIQAAGASQNGILHSLNLLAFRGRLGGLFPHRATLKFGPLLEGDLTERSDAAYASPRIRTFRVGAAVLPSFNVTEKLGVELGYIQKFYGVYFRATKDFFAGVRVVF